MKKIILSLFIAGLFSQANAQNGEVVVKTGNLFLEKAYTLELTYSPALYDVELLDSRTTYTPEEQDCNYLRPATCSTNVNFKIGSVQVRILDRTLEPSKQELYKKTLTLTGYSYFERNPIGKPTDEVPCDSTLPSNHEYYVYQSFDSDILFTFQNTNFDLSTNLNGVTVIVKNGTVQSPTSLNLSTIGGWAYVNKKSMRWETKLHTPEEWADIDEQIKNAPERGYEDRD